MSEQRAKCQACDGTRMIKHFSYLAGAYYKTRCRECNLMTNQPDSNRNSNYLVNEAAERFKHSDGCTEGCRECFQAGALWCLRHDPIVRGMREALRKLKGAMWSENIDEQNDAYEFAFKATAAYDEEVGGEK